MTTFISNIGSLLHCVEQYNSGRIKGYLVKDSYWYYLRITRASYIDVERTF